MKYAWTVFALVLLLLSGCSSTSKESSSSTTTDNTPLTGKQIYVKSCAACHGDKLQGVAGPTLVNIKSKYTEEEIENIISKGVKTMPPKLVDKKQAKTVAKWLLTK